MLVVFGAIFGLLLCSGAPIFVTLGLSSLIMLYFFSPIPIFLVAEIMYNSLSSFALLAVPFFTIAGHFMLRGGTSKHLINLANCLVGHWTGGLAVVCVLTCMFFAAICGSSVATALAMSVIIVPAMIRHGYSDSFATGVVASSGTMGIMIPPSITMILYGVVTETSVPRLFLGGFLPGFVEGGLYIGWIYYFSKRMGFKRTVKATRRETFNAIIKSLPALTLPVVVLGGIYSGIVTVTEASALAAGASMVIALFIYREVKLQQIFSVTFDAMKTTAMIYAIIATASVFGHWITHAGITADLVSYVRGLNPPIWVFLAFVNLIFLFLGMFLEVVSILLITIPILFPVIIELGIDPIHFGVMFVCAMEVALITPPVGLNLFVLSGAAKVPLDRVIRGAFPFVILGLIEIALLAYWPPLTLFLPNLLIPK